MLFAEMQPKANSYRNTTAIMMLSWQDSILTEHSLRRTGNTTQDMQMLLAHTVLPANRRQLYNDIDQRPGNENVHSGVGETGLITCSPRIRLLQPMQDFAPCPFQDISSLSEGCSEILAVNQKSRPALLPCRSLSPDLLTGMVSVAIR